MIEEIKLKCKQVDFEGYRVKIEKVGDYPYSGYNVYIDGNEIKKVRRVSFDIEVGNLPIVTLDIIEE